MICCEWAFKIIWSGVNPIPVWIQFISYLADIKTGKFHVVFCKRELVLVKDDLIISTKSNVSNSVPK